MGYIKLEKIIVHNGKLTYYFSSSEDINQFFTDTPFEIEYPENISNVPKSVLTIPFVCNVLPIIWLTDSTLFLEEIDKAFFESIPEFKSGYVEMYPNAEFKGEIKVERIVENSFTNEGRAAMFYSGGLDSASTLISHLDEKPILLSIWGSDVKYNNEKGWNLVHSAITETTERFGLEEFVFRSTFREFDNEGLLDKAFSEILGDGWWHGVKHGIGLLGIAAPFLFNRKISTMYIASSFSPKYGFHTCASAPSIDNYVKFSSCAVVHDGYEYSRQDKIHRIIRFSKVNDSFLKLHVCWESQAGSNCCKCEKCLRTICGIWSEGENPCNYGFELMEENVMDSYEIILKKANSLYLIPTFYPEIQDVALKNKHLLSKSQYYPYLKWILTTDFNHPEKIKMPLSYRMRNRLFHVSFYKKLHVVKERIKGKK